MSSVSSRTRTDAARDFAKLASMLDEIRVHLEGLRRALAAEIRNYPTPIPRCDAQFNHLYEQQAGLARDLDRIRALAGKNPKRGETIEFIRQFVASAPYTDDPAERQLRSRLEAELSAVGK
ncbi:MAG: hypothetical protein E6H59_06900 [Betaproteobacteria bacterium]|nr:MAG: hypothetical protein E6H59_06900 [Betaproteobacteria bacterium]